MGLVIGADTFSYGSRWENNVVGKPVTGTSLYNDIYLTA